jgi:hypothetical protein
MKRHPYKIRLRLASPMRHSQFNAKRAYEARYRGQRIGLIYRRKKGTWIVWQDSHGHEAKGQYRRRGDAKRALLRAVIEFRKQWPQCYGAP